MNYYNINDLHPGYTYSRRTLTFLLKINTNSLEFFKQKIIFLNNSRNNATCSVLKIAIGDAILEIHEKIMELENRRDGLLSLLNN